MSHGKAAEITVNPSSQHGHQGDNDVFILNEDNAKFVLFRSSHDTTYIYGKNDLAAYYGGGEQTIYDFGTGAHLQFSEIMAPIKVYGLSTTPTPLSICSMRRQVRCCNRTGMAAQCSATLTS